MTAIGGPRGGFPALARSRAQSVPRTPAFHPISRAGPVGEGQRQLCPPTCLRLPAGFARFLQKMIPGTRKAPVRRICHVLRPLHPEPPARCPAGEDQPPLLLRRSRPAFPVKAYSRLGWRGLQSLSPRLQPLASILLLLRRPPLPSILRTHRQAKLLVEGPLPEVLLRRDILPAEGGAVVGPGPWEANPGLLRLPPGGAWRIRQARLLSRSLVAAVPARSCPFPRSPALLRPWCPGRQLRAWSFPGRRCSPSPDRLRPGPVPPGEALPVERVCVPLQASRLPGWLHVLPHPQPRPRPG